MYTCKSHKLIVHLINFVTKTQNTTNFKINFIIYLPQQFVCCTCIWHTFHVLLKFEKWTRKEVHACVYARMHACIMYKTTEKLNFTKLQTLHHFKYVCHIYTYKSTRARFELPKAKQGGS